MSAVTDPVMVFMFGTCSISCQTLLNIFMIWRVSREGLFRCWLVIIVLLRFVPDLSSVRYFE